ESSQERASIPGLSFLRELKSGTDPLGHFGCVGSAQCCDRNGPPRTIDGDGLQRGILHQSTRHRPSQAMCALELVLSCNSGWVAHNVFPAPSNISRSRLKCQE